MTNIFRFYQEISKLLRQLVHWNFDLKNKTMPTRSKGTTSQHRAAKPKPVKGTTKSGGTTSQHRAAPAKPVSSNRTGKGLLGSVPEKTDGN